jgi:pyruvate dehydrogenase E1 component
MFGFQRIGDLVWAAGDMMCKGFLVGATAGRTTLAGEGLQHQDGQSHLYAWAVPNVHAYDPAFAFEMGVIVREGLKRMYVDNKDGFYYLTVENDKYIMPARPKHVKDEAILKGLYKFKPAEKKDGPRAHLWGSGAILNEAIKAQVMLTEYGVSADVWSVTSYKELYMDGLACERENTLSPGKKPKRPFVAESLHGEEGVIVAASDYVKALSAAIAKWAPLPMVSLGTDGFGLSEDRARLRSHFEVDARFIALGALSALARDGQVPEKTVKQAIKNMEIDPAKPDPFTYHGEPATTGGSA